MCIKEKVMTGELDISQSGVFLLEDGTQVIVDYSQGSNPDDLVHQLNVAASLGRRDRVVSVAKAIMVQTRANNQKKA